MDLYGLKTFQDRYHKDNAIESLKFSYGDHNLVWHNKCPVISQSYLLKQQTSNHPDDIWGTLGMYEILAQAQIYLHMTGRQIKIVSSHPIHMEYPEKFNPILKKPYWDGEKFEKYADRPPSRYVLLMDYDYVCYPHVILYPVFKDGEMKEAIFPLEELRVKVLHMRAEKYHEDFL